MEGTQQRSIARRLQLPLVSVGSVLEKLVRYFQIFNEFKAEYDVDVVVVSVILKPRERVFSMIKW